ncbi:MAG: T9SS type A sorting domain-containing protein [Bacteroidetes bacterium]|nr:T9SS type A sorting domain-containing protein [Bacteroidota bacterium]
MKKKFLFILFFVFALTMNHVKAQTTAGSCFYVDYDSWNAGGTHPPVYIDCGTSNVFNTGYELTMEVWIRIYNSSWNQKIMGKVTNTFNNGYVMAMQTGNYAEVWDPVHYQLISGSVPVDSAWVHLAMTYAAGGQLTEYINGVNVGSINAGVDPIASSTNPFIIGMAPWDLISFQTFGSLDEVRVWSIARSQADIRSTMFKHLQGNEAGLIAYYDFNSASGTNVPDLTSNANNGTVDAAAAPYYSWQPSYAAVGGDEMYNMTDVNAVWFGKDPAQYNFGATTNGLSIISNIQSKHFDYAVFGHNDSAGTSTTHLPAGASVDFKRLSREWYFNKGGNISADLYFNLYNAAAGGDTLALNQPVQYYTLLVRDSASQDYSALACADNLYSGGTVVKFAGLPLDNKYYTIGVGSTQLATTLSVDAIQNKNENNTLYPNPACNYFTVDHAGNAVISMYNTMGCLLKQVKSSGDLTSVDVHDISNGIYFVEIRKHEQTITKRIVIQKN